MEIRKTRVCSGLPCPVYCVAVLCIVCIIFNTVIYLGQFKLTFVKGSNSTDQKKAYTVPTFSNITVVNPHDYKYILNEPDACSQNPVVVIVVCTSMKNFAERETLRNTWGSVGKKRNSNVTVVYLVGSGSTAEMQAKLENESSHHRDIIQENFIDSYNNLSIKSQAMLKWVSTFCMTSKYVLKADDDMFVNVPNLITVLSKQTDEKFVLGVIFDGARPIQNPTSKWYTPLKMFNENVYPRYTSGTAYSMSTKSVLDLYRSSLQIPMFWLEDIYITGLCARKARIKHITGEGFNYGKLAVTGCANSKSVTSHRNTMTDIYKIYHELHDSNIKCNSQIKNKRNK